jgi:hypothetical protein
MADCSKSIANLTPGEAFECASSFLGGRLRAALDSIGSVTIGQWIEGILPFAILPAQFVSYILPFLFVGACYRRWIRQEKFSSSELAKGRARFWGAYLLAAGLVTLYFSIGNREFDRFMLIQGSWECLLSVMIILLGPSWWSEKVKQELPT